MTLRTFIKKAVLGSKIPAKKKMAASKGARMVSVKTVRLEDLKITKPRTVEEIKQAYSEGHIAEMTPHQAGL